MRGKFLKVITLNSKIDDWGGKIPTQFLNSLVRDAADAGGFASIFLGFQMQEFFASRFCVINNNIRYLAHFVVRNLFIPLQSRIDISHDLS